MATLATAQKPRQSFAGLWNISFGFFGIQIGFALQNANMSRIFQSLGSSLDDLPALWIAAPLTGLLVQPVVGHLSDRTWLGRLGRRSMHRLRTGSRGAGDKLQRRKWSRSQRRRCRLRCRGGARRRN